MVSEICGCSTRWGIDMTFDGTGHPIGIFRTLSMHGVLSWGTIIEEMEIETDESNESS
jgi:hypothetical protein